MQQSKADIKSCPPEVVMKQASGAKPKLDIFNVEVLPPLAMTMVYIWVLTYIARGGEDLATYQAREKFPSEFIDTSVWGPIVGCTLYLSFLVIGTRVMKNREPMNITYYILCYNTYQVILNIWMVLSFIAAVYKSGMKIWGNPFDTSANAYRISFLVWIHYSNKYMELLDTVFMVLRKKNNQVSFLHVYHHTLLIWSWYAVCKIAVSGDSYFGATVNSFIHVVMYSYYLTSLLGYVFPFKSYITLLQMGQFVLCASQSIYDIYYGYHSTVLCALQLFVMINMLVLFGNFYRKAYNKKKTK